jgi:hypothetical protein
LIGTEDCLPPCWEGIIPGETTFEEALDFVRDLEFVGDEGNLDYDFDKTYILWYRGDSNSVGIRFHENKVIYIRLDFVGIDLGSVVNHFGEPAGYRFGMDDGLYYAYVFYPNLGIVFDSYHDSARISKNMLVSKAYFLYPADEEYFPTIYYLNRKLVHPRLQEPSDYYQWEGFGVYPFEKD